MTRRLVHPTRGIVTLDQQDKTSKKEPTTDTAVSNPRALSADSPTPDLQSLKLRAPDRSNEPREGEMFGTEFLDNIAHQMVAPLQSVEMHCVNILDGIVKGDDIEKRLREVVGHARMLSELARRMRFLHELVSDKVIDAEKMEFEKIVTTWIDGFNNYLPLVRQLKLNVDIDHQAMNRLPDVIASRLAAHQVVMNVYDNAMKYGKPNTRITIRGKKEYPFILNEVSHHAKIPVTPEMASRIGTRGFRSEEAKRLRASGTGLGMWISKRLMEAMQGSIEVLPTTSEGITRILLKWRIAP